MEELSQLNQLSLAWGSISNVVDRIIAIEEGIDGGWPELVDMVGDAMTEEGENKDPASTFLNLYGFLYHLLFRLKADNSPRVFNKYEHIEWGTLKEDVFVITNYDYKVFKWARKAGYNDRIDNERIIIAANKLTSEQRRALDRRCEKKG